MSTSAVLIIVIGAPTILMFAFSSWWHDDGQQQFRSFVARLGYRLVEWAEHGLSSEELRQRLERILPPKRGSRSLRMLIGGRR